MEGSPEVSIFFPKDICLQIKAVPIMSASHQFEFFELLKCQDWLDQSNFGFF